jgi:hypothetical protein
MKTILLVFLLAQTAESGFPWLALLILLAPVVIMIYKSRGKKTPDIKSCA